MANNGRKEVYFIKPAAKEGGKAFWMRVGIAFENKDGSYNIKLDVPVIPGMDLQMRTPTEKEDKFE